MSEPTDNRPKESENRPLQWCGNCKQWTAPEVAGHTTHWYACPLCGWPTTEKKP